MAPGKENTAEVTRFGFKGGTGAALKVGLAGTGAPAKLPNGSPSEPVQVVAASDAAHVASSDVPLAFNGEYDLHKIALVQMPEHGEWSQVLDVRPAGKIKAWDVAKKCEQNQELIPKLKEIVNTLRQERNDMYEQADEVQGQMDKDLGQLSAYQEEAAKLPALKKQQVALESAVADASAACAASDAAADGALERIEMTVEQAEAKEAELTAQRTKLAENNAKIQSVQDKFKEDTRTISTELAIAQAEQETLEAQKAERKTAKEQKEEDLRSLLANREKQLERNQQAEAKEQDVRREMLDKKDSALAQVASLQSQIASVEVQIEQAQVELKGVRESDELHIQRANQNKASLEAASKEQMELDETVTKLETAVETSSAQIATTTVEKEQLILQAHELDEEARPLRQEQSTLQMEVEALRQANTAHNASLREIKAKLEEATEQLAVEAARCGPHVAWALRIQSVGS